MNFLLDHDVPDDLSYLIEQLGHDVTRLREILPVNSSDGAVLKLANGRDYGLLTCNRGDFLNLASTQPHHGIVIVIRRRTRAAERTALFQLLERVGDVGIRNNINFS